MTLGNLEARRTVTVSGILILAITASTLLPVPGAGIGHWASNPQPADGALNSGAVPAGIFPSLGPALLVSPATGGVGTTVAASGSGFAVSSTVSLSFAGIAVTSTCSTDSTGSFPGTSGTACTFMVPPVPHGLAVVSASDGASTANASFEVESSVALSPTSGVVGSKVFATGTGFAANSNITFSFAGTLVNSTCSTDSKGSFPGASGTTCTFAPPAAPHGAENVVATDGRNSAQIGVGSGPYGIAYDSGKGEVFVANFGSSNVSVIGDTTNAVVASVAVTGGASPIGVAYDSGRSEVFVTDIFSNNMSVIADSNNTVVASVNVSTYPFGVAYDSGKGELFVTDYGSHNVSIFSDSNNSLITTIAVGTSPTGVAYDSGKGEVFVANDGSTNVSVISDSNNSVVATVPVGSYPVAVAYDSGLGEVFVANDGSNNVSVISDTSNTVVATVAVGTTPFGVAYNSARSEVFVSNEVSNNVSVISDSNDSVVSTLAIGASPHGVSYDSGLHEVFVANDGSDNVSVLALGNRANDSFTVNSSLSLLPVSGSVDVGQTITVQANGYGSSLLVSTFTLGPYPLYCTSATTGNCTGGAATTDPAGSLVATTTVPSVSASGSYSVKLADTAGNNATAMIHVYTDPTVATPSASRPSVDLGQSVTFSAVASFGTGSYSYAWLGLPTGCVGSQPATVCTPSGAGSYSVSVRVTDSDGQSVTSGPLGFVVYTDPTVSTPSATPVSGQVDGGQTVTFATAAQLGTLTYTSYTWSGLPAGCTGSSASVACAGPNLPPGTYLVSVTVTDSNSYASAASGSLSFVVLADPTVSTPSATPASADVGQSVTFSAAAAFGSGLYTYTWTGLPTGCSGTTPNLAPCRLTSEGVFMVRMTVTDSNNLTVTSAALTFTVFSDPTVSVSADRTSVDVGAQVNLVATAGLGSGGYTYSWADLPNGCRGTTATIACSPAAPGKGSVTVKITDSNGVAALSSAVLLIVAPALSVNISATPSSPTTGHGVTFASNISGGTAPLAYAWAFGDGSSGSGPTVTHTFGSAGDYTVMLWVNDSGGGSVEKVISVTVSKPTTAFEAFATAYGPATAILAAIILAATVVLLLARRRKSGKKANQGSEDSSPAKGLDEASQEGPVAGSSPEDGAPTAPGGRS